MVRRSYDTVGSGGLVGDGSLGSQNFTSQEGTLGSWSTNAPDDFDWSGDEDGRFPVSRLRQQYIDYLSAKILEYEEQKQSRHYYHAAQWTPEEIRVLRSRKQPVITYNRVGRKIDQIVGLVQRMRQDPKAYPRNPQNSDGAEIATQCVRTVLEGNDWEFIDPYCAGQAGIEGIAGVEFKLVEGDHDDPDVAIDFVFGDDFFYDPRSYKPDFSDARYMGVAKWLDVEAAVELFPDKEIELRTLMVETGFDLTTHADREFKWVYVNEKRLRLVEHWYRHRGKWYWAFYCSMIMLAQGVSPFIDERNNPMCRFCMFSANVDHDGDRYGFVRNLKGPQDELNQRRSKALFMTNVTAMYLQKGAVDDVERARRERARPEGVVEYNPGFPKPEDIVNTEKLQTQLGLMQDARQEIDGFANITPDLITRDVQGDHSGVAINLLQRAGIAEIGTYLRNYKAWKRRVYKMIWCIVQRTWTAERWIRVSGSQPLAQFLQINGMQIDQFGRPTFINQIGNIYVEMDMDEGPDEANLMQDAYDQIKNDPTIPFPVKLQFMPISDTKKQQISKMMQQQPDPAQQAAQQIALRQGVAQARKTEAQAADVEAQSAERHTRSLTNVARSAHLAHEANMDVAGFVREGLYQATKDQTPGQDSGAPSPQPSPAPAGGSLGQAGPQPVPPQAAAQQPQPMPGAAPQVVRIPHDHPIMQHARMARDGRPYVPDPRRPGKWMMVA